MLIDSWCADVLPLIIDYYFHCRFIALLIRCHYYAFSLMPLFIACCFQICYWYWLLLAFLLSPAAMPPRHFFISSAAITGIIFELPPADYLLCHWFWFCQLPCHYWYAIFFLRPHFAFFTIFLIFYLSFHFLLLDISPLITLIRHIFAAASSLSFIAYCLSAAIYFYAFSPLRFDVMLLLMTLIFVMIIDAAWCSLRW